MTLFGDFLLPYSIGIIYAAIIIIGFLVIIALLIWLSEWLLNLIATSLKVHKEFLDFLRHKYIKKTFKPTINNKEEEK